ncbi:MAG: glycosyltransferase family 1 protein [Gemmataceae bacterium]|nr:glycosyltransferase family 1 protein [Gemmataceae bacterium]
MTPPCHRLAVVRDARAEGWPSMDLCADQLLAHLQAAAPGLTPADLEAPFHRTFQRVPVVGRRNAAFNADRLVYRHLTLPRFLRRGAAGFDLFHVVDHTYAHAVHALPLGRAGVYCHDLVAFRSLLEPEHDRRPWWFRQLAARTLWGLQAAAVVFHSTGPVRDEILRHRLVDPSRLVHAPYGVSAEFTPDPAGPVDLPAPTDLPFLLHVSSNVPRKRVDVLLDVFAAVRTAAPGLQLVQVGGPWPPHLLAQIDRLGIRPYVTQVRGLSRGQLAELYRRAAAVLVPSEAEGFGLPVIEALACGSVVVASDIPALREVGGDAAVYRPVADVPAWADAVRRVIHEPGFAPPRDARLAAAARYSWKEHAAVIGRAYLSLASRAGQAAGTGHPPGVDPPE